MRQRSFASVLRPQPQPILLILAILFRLCSHLLDGIEGIGPELNAHDKGDHAALDLGAVDGDIDLGQEHVCVERGIGDAQVVVHESTGEGCGRRAEDGLLGPWVLRRKQSIMII